MHGTQEIETKAVEGLVAAHFSENDVHLDIPRAYVRQHIPADRDEIPRPETASRWASFAENRQGHTWKM